MIKISALLLSTFLIFQTSYSQGIEFFHGEWKEALAEAKKQDKLLFVDAYAQWCGPCKKMAKNVFTQAQVGEYFNSNFVNLKLDMETADGRKFGSKYPVSAYPTLLFLNGDGEIVKKVTGGQQADGLIGIGKNAIKSYDKSGDYAVLYEKGDRSFDLMMNYVTELNKVGKPSLKISNDYINSKPEISATQKAQFLMTAVTESDSRLFDMLLEHKSQAENASSPDAFRAKVESAIMATVSKAVEYDYPDMITEALGKYKKVGIGDSKKFEQEAHLEYHKLAGNYSDWKKLAEKYIKKYGKKDHSVLKQQIATLKSDFSYEKDAKPYACDVCKELVKKDDNAANYSEYIQLLMDCRKYDEARKVTNEAIKAAEKRNEDTKKFNRIIEYLDTI